MDILHNLNGQNRPKFETLTTQNYRVAVIVQ